MQGRRYLIYDVFTQASLGGNPLAIVLDCEGLDGHAMQRIARQFNLSETVFVLPAEQARHRAKIRIFAPDYEMPFAGHPTVGAAVALAAESGEGASIFVLEENIGPVRCAVSYEGRFAEFDLPKLPERIDARMTPEAVGAALGLAPHEMGFENHRLSCWSAGVAYVMVPVAGLKEAAKARIDPQLWAEVAPLKSETAHASAHASAYVYCRETVRHDSAFHARMFVAGNPSYEDPATGSAAAAFAGAIMHFDGPCSVRKGEGMSTLWIEQGLEMGRPSRIRLELEVRKGYLAAARIGGYAVRTAEGRIFV